MSLVGRTYLECGMPVKILKQWRAHARAPRREIDALEAGYIMEHVGDLTPRRFAPRNVLIRREDGTLVVRPFRGLRKP